MCGMVGMRELLLFAGWSWANGPVLAFVAFLATAWRSHSSLGPPIAGPRFSSRDAVVTLKRHWSCGATAKAGGQKKCYRKAAECAHGQFILKSAVKRRRHPYPTVKLLTENRSVLQCSTPIQYGTLLLSEASDNPDQPFATKPPSPAGLSRFIVSGIANLPVLPNRKCFSTQPELPWNTKKH